MRYAEIAEATPKSGWDHYTDIGHKRSKSNVWYMLPGGELREFPYTSKKDNHDVLSGDGLEAKAIAVGRVDFADKKISIRTPLAPDNAHWMIPQAKLDFIARRLRRKYPGYQIWYFGNAATDIRKLDESLADWGDEWVHYSKEPYLKINPKPFHQDPAGIYLFPAKFTAEASMWNQMPYKFRVRLKPNIRVLDFGALDVNAVLALADKIGLGDGLRSDIAQYKDYDSFNAENPKDLLRALWHRVRTELKGYSRWAALNKVFRDLGYDAIFDDTRTIHVAEVQMLVLDPRAIASAELIVNKTQHYDAVMKVFNDVQKLAHRFGSVEDIEMPKRKRTFGGNAEVRGDIKVTNPTDADNYARVEIVYAPKEQQHAVRVSLRYSSPSLGYGSGATFDMAQQKYQFDGLKGLERDLGKVFGQGG